MHIVFRLALILTALALVAHGQGARGGGARGGSSGIRTGKRDVRATQFWLNRSR